MKVIKKINNNVAVCVDASGRQLVAFGKGIGFPSMPYDINDMTLIERTFYDMDDRFLPMLAEIPSEIFDVARQVADRASRTIDTEFNANMPFTLADHINFCIERERKRLNIKLPAIGGIELLYPKEVEVAKFAIELINKTLGVNLPKIEVAGIAMNIINAEMESASYEVNYNEEAITEGIIQIIEQAFNTKLDRMSYDYVRLDTHLRYMYARIGSNSSIEKDYIDLYDPLRKESPRTEECVNKIAEHLKVIWKTEIDNNERLYLWLHIDRAVRKAEMING